MNSGVAMNIQQDQSIFFYNQWTWRILHELLKFDNVCTNLAIRGGKMKDKFTRREFLRAGVGVGVASVLKAETGFLKTEKTPDSRLVVASGNGLKAAEKAMEMLMKGEDPLDSVIAGVNIVENDPEDTSVGYGGLPNEDGVVELDASVMHGPTHNGGGVASLRNIKNPSRVAKLVMERTDHVLLVGQGALRFARAHGFKEENLLTDKARKLWLEYKETLSGQDYWLSPRSHKISSELRSCLSSHGTINCIALDKKGNLAGVTTTSGHSFKIPGRVGDSPIIGAGLYVDNDVGAAGSTGRGEANLLNLGSYQVVDFMQQGLSPEEACLRTLERIVEKSKLISYLFDDTGYPKFDLEFYALSKRGEYGAASLLSGENFVVHDGKLSYLKESPYLFKEK
jgi:N4-(beta-N-acetylglucosaminyl)-L-asparaginase